MRGRVLLAKVGLDGHDRGVKVVGRVLRDEGYEVIYTGMRQEPSTVVSIAEQEDVTVIGLSILSGAHRELTAEIMRQLRDRGLDGDIDVVVGGTVPRADVPDLVDAGVAAVFGVGSTLADITAWFNSRQVGS